jgi:sugar-specific transcriptional regulator TrmB
LLNALGLGRNQTDCYSALVGRPPSTASTVANATGLTLDEVVVALDELEQLKLVCRPDSPSHYAASPPSIALGAMVAERQLSLQEAQRQVDALTDVYRSASEREGSTETLDVIRGEEALISATARLMAGARSTIQSFAPTSLVTTWSHYRPTSTRLSADNVHNRTVLERGLATHQSLTGGLGAALGGTIEIRFVPRLASRLLIVDSEVGIIPLRHGTGDFEASLVVRSSGMLQLLQALFDRTWKSAAPLIRNDDQSVSIRETELEPTDLALLRLLNLGLTDAVVAKQLKMSLRTIQRRVALLMEFADVHSRLQLGVVAVRRGWL